MANRPSRNSATTKKKLSQEDINNTKPVGTLSLAVLTGKSTRVLSINVKLPDGEIWKFYHTPMTLADSRAFFEDVEENRLTALRDNVHSRLVNEDGTPLADDPEVWENVDIKIIDSICNAMLESAKTEAGED